jgi:hypothetical protein
MNTKNLIFLFSCLISLNSVCQENVISLTEFDKIIEQNFDDLGTGTSSVDVLPGWYISEGGSEQTSLSSNNGSILSTGVFNYGNSSDRAIGGRATNNNESEFVWKFKNETGEPMRSFSVYYTGEQWYGALSGDQFLEFEFGYGSSASNLTYVPTDFDFQNTKACNTIKFRGQLYCTTPKGPLDGNSEDNKLSVNIVFNLSGFEIAPGEYFALKWKDVNNKNLLESHALALDDVGFIAFVDDAINWYAVNSDLDDENSWTRYPNNMLSGLKPEPGNKSFLDDNSNFIIRDNVSYVGDFQLEGTNTKLVLEEGSELTITAKKKSNIKVHVVIKPNATLNSNIYQKNGSIDVNIDSCYDGSKVIFNSNSPNKGEFILPGGSYYDLEIADDHGSASKEFKSPETLEVRNDFLYSADESVFDSEQLKLKFTGAVTDFNMPNHTGENVFSEFTIAAGNTLNLQSLLYSPEHQNALILDADVNFENSSSLSLVADNTLILMAGNFQHDGELDLANDASLIINDGVGVNGTGKTTIVRNQSITGNEITNHWSSPVKNTKIGPGQTIAGNRTWLYLNGEDDNSDYARMTSAIQLPIGRGCTAKGNLGSTFVANVPTDLNYGSFVYHADAEHDGDADEEEYYLVGNPYSSGLSAEAFLTENSENRGEILGTIYLFSQVNEFGNYSKSSDNMAVNLLGATDPGFTSTGSSFDVGDFEGFSIASGQGFLVVDRTRDDDQIDLQFSPAMQLGLNNSFKARNSSNILSRFWLLINDGKNYKTALMGFASDATIGEDNTYDAPLAVTSQGLNIWSQIGVKAYEIQGLPPTDKATLRVPVGVNVVRAGAHEISTVRKTNAPTEPITLYDSELNVYHDISKSAYQFTSTKAGEIRDRFILFVQGSGSPVGVDDIDENEINCAVINQQGAGSITLNKDLKTLQILGLSGKEIYFGSGLQYGQTIETPKEGLYVVKAEDLNGKACATKYWLY